MKTMNMDMRYLKDFLSQEDFDLYCQKAKDAYLMLKNKIGKGNAFLGWLDLPVSYNKEEFDSILKTTKYIQENADILLVIGIGGSYLGAKSAMNLLLPTFKKNNMQVIFVGHHLESDYVNEVVDYLKDKDFCINVISKSGTTTEPAVMFRIFKKLIEKKYGIEESIKRIFVTTDEKEGALKKLANNMNYKTFTIPSDIGGRYSILSAVGLLPISVSGLDIVKLMSGAKKAYDDLNNMDTLDNDAIKYAALRNLFYAKGKKIENLVSYNPKFLMFGEWFKQLFAESEGKNNLGLFVMSSTFSTDLHSIGQMIQEGERILFQTVLNVKTTKSDIMIPHTSDNLDNLNYIANKGVSFVNECAMKGTLIAHSNANVPNIVFDILSLDEYTFGYMVYFFMLSCGISAYTLGVNPFDQEGVEAYKKNMFALLGKEEYKSLREKLLNNDN